MKIDKFKTFLKESGAELLETTNEYELVRFRTINGVSIIYRGKSGYSFTGDAQEAYDAMKNKSIWSAQCNGMKKKKAILNGIVERDGCECFYCGAELHKHSSGLLPYMTIEHVLSVSCGGNNNFANLVLSCKWCNLAVGDSSIIEKIKYRDTVRGYGN